MKEKKRYFKAVDIFFAVLTFIFLQYLLSCWLLSFRAHVLWIFLIALNAVIIGIFWNRITHLIQHKIFCLIIFVLCFLVLVWLLWGIGYFPVSIKPFLIR